MQVFPLLPVRLLPQGSEFLRGFRPRALLLREDGHAGVDPNFGGGGGFGGFDMGDIDLGDIFGSFFGGGFSGFGGQQQRANAPQKGESLRANLSVTFEDEAVGQMYVEKYFPAAAKERMVTLVKNLQERRPKQKECTMPAKRLLPVSSFS